MTEKEFSYILLLLNDEDMKNDKVDDIISIIMCLEKTSYILELRYIRNTRFELC